MLPYVKLAGLFDQLQAEAEQSAAYDSANNLDFGAMRGGTFTTREALPTIGGSIAGETGEGAGKLLSKILSWTGAPIDNPYATGYGANISDARRSVVAERLLSDVNKEQLADSVRRLGGTVGLNIPISDKWLGRGLDVATQAAPQLSTALGVLDPSFASDYSPIAQASARLNGGQFDPNVFNNVRQQFDAAYASGVFGNVPKSVAMVSLPASIDLLGDKVNMGQVANLSAAAHSLVQTGLAGSYGEAMKYVGQFDPRTVASDPSSVANWAASVRQQMGQAGITPQQMAAVNKAVSRGGQSLPQSISAVLSGSQLRKELGGQGSANRGVINATANALSSRNNTAAVLEAAGQFDRGFKSRVDAATKAGDHATLQQLAQQAAMNPAIMEAARRMDGSGVMARAGLNGTRALNMAEAKQYMQDNGIRAPADLDRRMKDNDWSGVDSQTALAFMRGGRTGGSLGGALMTNKPIKETTFKDIRPPRLGLSYHGQPSA